MGYIKKIICITAILLLPSVCVAAPTVSSISGSLVNGSALTISGSSFGSAGPTIALFDDFNTESNGTTISTAAVIGTWNTIGAIPAKGFSDSILSGGMGANLVTYPSYSIMSKVFTETNQVFVSSYLYIPDGYRFPSATAEETMPAASGLKHHWVMYSSSGYGGAAAGADLFGLNWTGGDWDYVASNDGGTTDTFDTYNTVAFTWDEPMRITHWYKGNGETVIGTDGMGQTLSASYGQILRDYDGSTYGKALFPSGVPTYTWDRVNLAGYLNPGITEYDAFITDDVYIATGDNASARVEIGNNSTYSSCSKLAISTPTAWADGSVTATVREGLFKSGDQIYVFVIDSNNDPSTGLGPYTFGNTYGGGTHRGFVSAGGFSTH